MRSTTFAPLPKEDPKKVMDAAGVNSEHVPLALAEYVAVNMSERQTTGEPASFITVLRGNALDFMVQMGDVSKKEFNYLLPENWSFWKFDNGLFGWEQLDGQSPDDRQGVYMPLRIPGDGFTSSEQRDMHNAFCSIHHEVEIPRQTMIHLYMWHR